MQVQQAWFVVAGIFKIPSFPIVAPYMAMSTEPTGFNLTDVFSKAIFVITSWILSIKESFKSPVFSQGISPP